jgi:hypothetical protein
MAAADAASLAALRGATLADVLAHKFAAAPDRRRVLLLEHSMTVAEAHEGTLPPRARKEHKGMAALLALCFGEGELDDNLDDAADDVMSSDEDDETKAF